MSAKILITGFEGYAGRGINPSGEIAGALQGTSIAGHEVIAETIPVEYSSLGSRLDVALERHRPRLFIALGLWPGEPVIRIERVAVNIADFEIPDNSASLERGPLAPAGPDALISPLPVRAMRDRLLDAGIPARLSSTAGNFLCNALLYRALHRAAEMTPQPACGFIHVPYFPEQIAELIRETEREARLELHQRADLASMARETQTRGIRLALEAALEGIGASA